MSRTCVCSKGVWENAIHRLLTEVSYVVHTEPLYHNVNIDPERIHWRSLAHSILERMCAQGMQSPARHVSNTPWLEGMPVGLFLARSLGRPDQDARNVHALLEAAKALPVEMRASLDEVLRRWGSVWFGATATKDLSVREVVQKILGREGDVGAVALSKRPVEQNVDADDDDDDDEEEEDLEDDDDDDKPVTAMQTA